MKTHVIILPVFRTALLIFSLFLLVVNARAQVIISVGPQLGANINSSPYEDIDFYLNQRHSFQTFYQTGIAAGIQGSITSGHFAIQPSLLFSQKGFRIQDTSDATTPSVVHATFDMDVRLNYLTLPLNFAYTFGSDGQGFQVFVGPYISWLLGGRVDNHLTQVYNSSPPTSSEYSAPVAGSGAYHAIDINSPTAAQDNTFYSRRVDAGFQAGIGYQWNAFLIQAAFSQGVRNLGVGTETTQGSQVLGREEGPKYTNRGFSFSFSYFLFSKREIPLAR